MSEEEQIILPERFKKLDWICSSLQSAGTNYIDTEIKPNQNTGFYVDFEMVNGKTNPIESAVLGSRNGSNNKDFQFSICNGGIIRFGDNYEVSVPFGLESRHIVYLKNREVYFDNAHKHTLRSNEWQGEFNVYLFSLNNSNSSIQGSETKIYRAKFYDGDTLLKDFVPAYDTYNCNFCMYDLVNEKAHYMNGSGPYTSSMGKKEDEQLGILHKLPEGFRKVKYLIANGNQYIDTNYIPTNETGYYIEAQSYSSSKDVHFFGCVNGTSWQTGVGRLYFCTGGSSAFYNCGWGTGQFQLSSSFNSSHMRQELKCEFNFLNRRKAKLTINEIDFIYKNIPNLNFVPSNSIYLFGTNMGGEKIHQTLLGRIDTFLISEGDQIVRQFVPCLDADGILCMYELYTGTVHYNQGSGQFSYPREYTNAPINLPAGYTKCVYLQSDGTQWINTQVVPDNETGLYFRALHLSYGNLVPFGVEQNGYGIYPPRYEGKNLRYKWGNTPIKMMDWDKADDLIFSSYLNFYNSKNVKFNSADTDAISIIDSQTGTFTIPICLFSWNYNGSYNATTGKWGGRIYRAQITQGDALIRDFVPCLDADNRPCMYDLISQEAYYNQSGGTEFSYCVEHELPSDFVKLKYLEDTGTQYINIGIIPTNETGLYVDANQTKHVNAHTIGSGCDENNTGFGVPRFMRGTANSSGFMWKGWNSYGDIGNGARFEGYLNFFNDRKANLKTAGTTERINNLGELGFTPTVSLYMFRTNYASHGNWNGRIYRAKITQGSELIRDFVPAYDTRRDKPCMYDLINNVAYYNNGTGEFLYNKDFEGTYKGFTGLGCIGNKLGSDYDPINEKLPSGYTRVDFLESKNGEYINLGLNATNFSSYIKFSMLTPTSFNGSGPAYVFASTSGTYRLEGWPYDGEMKWEPHWVLYNLNNSTNQWGGMIGSINYGEYAFCKIDFTSKKISVSSPYASKTVVTNIKDEFINLEHGELTLFPRNNAVRWFSRIYFYQGNYNGVDATNLIPSIDENGKPCFYDIIRQISLYNEKEDTDFIIGLKTISHALQLYLPDSGGTISLSLPTNDKTEIYEEKIRANNPNWVITFYYH